MSASGRLHTTPTLSKPTLDSSEIKSNLDDNEVKLDNAWKDKIDQLRRYIEKTYFIQIYFDSQTTAKQYHNNGKHSQARSECKLVITSIYDAILAMLETGVGNATIPSPKLRQPERIKVEINELIKTKIESIVTEKDTSQDNPQLILKKTLNFMRAYLVNMPVSALASEPEPVTSCCFFKSTKERPTYADFLKQCETLRASVEALFKHTELKKANRNLSAKADMLQALDKISNISNKSDSNAKPALKRAQTSFALAKKPAEQQPPLKRVVSLATPTQNRPKK